MKTFKKYFLEAISLSVAKEKNMTRKKSGAYINKQVNDVFGNKDRLIYDFDLDVEKDYSNIKTDPTSTFYKINELLEQYNFYIKNISDYIKGICYKQNDKNVYNIGKILNKFGQETELITKKGGKIKTTEEVEMYKSDPIKNITSNEMVVVVSRHPYDIYGASTDRSWTSCMNLEGGEMKCALSADVSKGSIVLYLVPKSELRENGKIALKKPLSRILLRPMVNKEQELAYAVGPNKYGAKIEKFKTFATDWATENFNSKVKNKKGFVYLKGLYTGDYSEYPNLDRTQEDLLKDRRLKFLDKAREVTDKFKTFLRRATISDNFTSLSYSAQVKNNILIFNSTVNIKIPVDALGNIFEDKLYFNSINKEQIRKELNNKNSDISKFFNAVSNTSVLTDKLNEIDMTANKLILSYSSDSENDNVHDELLREMFPIIQIYYYFYERNKPKTSI
jgi:hypothetical protein